MKTPAYYVAPLRSRAAIVAWLIERAESNSRPNYGLFCFNVKVPFVDCHFDNLAKIAKKNGELAANVSARYLEECRALCEPESLYEQAVEDARNRVTDDDTNRILWDGSKTVAEWEFAGRSGGWLVLKEFEGVNLSAYSSEELFNDEAGYKWLRNLYRFLVQCDHDFRREAIRTEIEYLAASNLFSNVCSDVETDEDETARHAREEAEATERAHWEARDTVTR